MASVTRNLDAQIAHMQGVGDDVATLAEDVETRAKASLSAHRAEGNARVTRERSGGTDWVVSLEDPAALSIEYGRAAYSHNGRSYGAAEGLYIMTRAAEGASA